MRTWRAPRAGVQALGYLTGRPGRTAAVVSVIALGLALALVVSASNESARATAELISHRNLPTRVEVGLAPVDDPAGRPVPMARDVLPEVVRLAGVESAVLLSDPESSDVVAAGVGASTHEVPVIDIAGDLGLVADVTSPSQLAPGAVVLSDLVARRRAITASDAGERVIAVDGRMSVVGGVIAPASTEHALGTSMARLVVPDDQSPDFHLVVVEVRPGAAEAVARVIADTLRPEAPNQLRVEVVGGALVRTDEPLLEVFESLRSAVSFGSVAATSITVLALSSAMVASRREEFGLRRAVGASRASVGAQVVAEVAMISVMAVVVAMPLASAAFVALARSRGWVAAVDGGVLLLLPVSTVAVAVVSALAPAWRAASTPPSLAIRDL